MAELVEFGVADGIARITINRPEVLNALDRAARQDLHQAFLACDGNRQVRVVVLTGAGEKAFCAGADIRELAGLSDDEAFEIIDREHALFSMIRTFAKPVVARVNGYALGAGMLLAMVADICLARSDARFGLPEVLRGTAAGYETALLPRYVGLARARAMALLGQRISGLEAERIGLINRALEPDGLDRAVDAVANRLAQMEPDAVAAQKRIINAWVDTGFDDAVEGSIPEVRALVARKTGEATLEKPALTPDPFTHLPDDGAET